MIGIIRLMTPMRAIGILDGTITWEDAREYLEAALYVSIHETQCRASMAAALYATALRVADYAVDHGEDAAVALIASTRRDAMADVDASKKLLETKQ
jgi:hypothetical protein